MSRGSRSIRRMWFRRNQNEKRDPGITQTALLNNDVSRLLARKGHIHGSRGLVFRSNQSVARAARDQDP
jgi:hypothetical protein